MALEKAREFFKSIEAGGQVMEEYRGLLTESKGLSEKEATDKVIRFASVKGFEISPEDIKSLAAEKQNRELSDEELNAVAGGVEVEWCMLGTGMAGGTSSMCFIIGMKAGTW